MNRSDDNIQLDFLKNDSLTDSETDNHNQITKPESGPKRGKAVIITAALIIFFISVFLYINVSASPLGLEISSAGWLQTLKHLITNDEKTLSGEQTDQINILLLGMGGAGHDGAYLTDTMMVVSFKPATKQVALVSIPRDLYVAIDGYGWKKVNHANAYGEINDYPGGGSALAAATVSQIIGQDITYWLRIDFSGFKKLINDLGGIDVYVEKSFTDNNYPDYQHGVQTISFSEGQQHFAGEQALQYARSRHGSNGQGSDFSRSARQMTILLAIKDKVMSAGTLLNPAKLADLYDNLTANIDTNVKFWEALRLTNLAKGTRQADIINKVIANGPDGLLTSYISDTGAYVLTTSSGDFSAIHSMFANIFPTQALAQEKARIIIYNGTNIAGLANETASKLPAENFEIIDIANAPSRDWDNTVIYNLQNGAQDKPNSLAFLQSLTQAQINDNLPFDIQEKILRENPEMNGLSNIDFIIILGVN